MTLDEHLNDRQAFEMAMFRVRARAQREGRNPTFSEMLAEAQKELEEEHRRLEKQVAEARADSGPSTEAT